MQTVVLNLMHLAGISLQFFMKSWKSVSDRERLFAAVSALDAVER
jgi:hypothetical protein